MPDIALMLSGTRNLHFSKVLPVSDDFEFTTLSRSPNNGDPVRPTDFDGKTELEAVTYIRKFLQVLGDKKDFKSIYIYELPNTTNGARQGKNQALVMASHLFVENGSFYSEANISKSTVSRTLKLFKLARPFCKGKYAWNLMPELTHDDDHIGVKQIKLIWIPSTATQVEPKPANTIPKYAGRIRVLNHEEFGTEVIKQNKLQGLGILAKDEALLAAVRARMLGFDAAHYIFNNELDIDGSEFSPNHHLSDFTNERYQDEAIIALALRLDRFKHSVRLLIGDKLETLGYASAGLVKADETFPDFKDHGDNFKVTDLILDKTNDTGSIALCFSGFRLRRDLQHSSHAHSKLIDAALAIYQNFKDEWQIDKIMLSLAQPTARSIVAAYLSYPAQSDEQFAHIDADELHEMYEKSCQSTQMT